MPIPPFLLLQRRANKRGPGPPSAPRGGAASGSGSWKDGMAEPGWSRASPSLERALGSACGGGGAARGEPLGMVIGFPLGMATGSLQKRHWIPPKMSQDPSKKRHRIPPWDAHRIPPRVSQDPSKDPPHRQPGPRSCTKELEQAKELNWFARPWEEPEARPAFPEGTDGMKRVGRAAGRRGAGGIPAAGACGTAAPVFPGFGSGMSFHGVGNWYPPAQPGPGVTGKGGSVIPNLSAP